MVSFLRSMVACALVGLACWAGGCALQKPDIGIDSNYALDMAKRKLVWKDASGPVDPFVLFARNGCRSMRIRLWVGEDGTNQLAYATETARRAQQAGLKPLLVLFLSEEWADFVKQPAPAVWKDLPVEKKAAAVEVYAEKVVRHMMESGVQVDTFAIGNEIDFGICGEFEPEWPHRVDLAWMQKQVWPRMVPILKAGQAGVRKAQPNAKFIVHLAQWNNSAYCIAFWRAMEAAGVQIDYLGLSYYPSSSEKALERSFSYLQGQVAGIADALHKPVQICETGYPAAAEFGGQFSSWNHAADGYPLTEAGQAQWIADLLAMARGDAHFAGVYYWSPEWYDGGLWDAFALFDAQGRARAGVRAFAAGIGKQPGTQPAIQMQQ